MAELAVAHETTATFSRKTKDGRTLRYEMIILQQPQRARACGAGAKSSADRRPVDPPPVVELKIFNGEHDVTFSHNANFFLYTTLESARQIATPKGGAISPQHPVLTGTPVAGMVYLDRPCHAGYFIFPDLSVRHEGKYKLSFNLFEEVKMDADMDPENENMGIDHPSAKLLNRSPSNPYQFVNFRMEVKSEAFNVFSAKKFPGLTESTDLSRCVAEQGCRVRIRRDVRIRVRKDMNPATGDFNRDSSEPHNDQVSTPGAMDQALTARPSNAAPTYPAIESKTTEQQYIKQSPYIQNANIQPLPSSTHYPDPPYNYGNTQPQYPLTNGIIPPPPPPPAYAASPFPQRAQHSRHNSTSSSKDFHSLQLQYPAPSQYTTAASSHTSSAYAVAIDTKFQTQPQGHQSSVAPDSASTTKSSILPALPNIQAMVAASPISYDPNAASGMKTKRGYSTVFNDVSSVGQVQFGSRNETSGQELPMIETEEHGVIGQDDLAKMRESMIGYRRADGRMKYRQLPKRSV